MRVQEIKALAQTYREITTGDSFDHYFLVSMKVKKPCGYEFTKKAQQC